MEFRIKMPDAVKMIIETLQNAGFEAYAVGGCVRDSILGREPNDWDITTSALPLQVKELFRRTVDTGIQHGTVTVMVKEEGFEVTTYRIDGEYEDARHPKQVTFTPNLREDLLRRDFTINAMAYNDEDGLVDIFGGIDDIQNRLIRCVGNPLERFTEDALRMMRAVRFAAQLGYEIHPDTLEAAKTLAPNLGKVSAERIQVELVKLLVSDHPERIVTAYEAGLTAIFLPEFDRCMETKQNNKHHLYDVGMHTVQTVMEISGDKVLRLAALFHDFGKPDVMTVDEQGYTHTTGHAEVGADLARSILRRLKFDNDTTKNVYILVKEHDTNLVPEPVAVRRFMYQYSAEICKQYLALQKADVLAQSAYKRKEKLERIEHIQEICSEILEKKEAVKLKDLAINGSDLIALGYKPGKEIGKMLNAMMQIVLISPEKNDKEVLIGMLRDGEITW